jgi:hypothetical protein
MYYTRYLCIKSFSDDRGHYVEGQTYYFDREVDPKYFLTVVDERGCPCQILVQPVTTKS